MSNREILVGHRYLLTQCHLNDWLCHITQTKTLVAPSKIGNVHRYEPVQSAQQISWSRTRPITSIKEFVFPATDRLFTIERNGQNISLTETLPDEETVIFGVRPCDAHGLNALDSLFIHTEPIDTYYQKRRENTTIIGLTCSEIGNTCFCTSMGISPDDSENMDLLLKEIDSGFIIDILTEKGKRLLSDQVLQEYEGSIPGQIELPLYPVPNTTDWLPLYDLPYWSDLSERCLSCRACAYVCPTCRCFDIRDDISPSENGHQTYERIRCWDSCTSVGYQRTAGGHNPRSEKSQRLRNRYFCKFYYFPQQYGQVACTGCGRCIDVCPVNIDIVEALYHLTEVIS